MTLVKTWVICSCVLLSACSYRLTHSYKTPEAPEHSAANHYQPQLSEMSVKAYTYMLADELLISVPANRIAGNIAVARFVDQNSRKSDAASGDQIKHLGGQLEEGFVYELTKRGFNVVDFKMMETIKVSESGDEVWSRNVNDLSSQVEAGYVLSGTLTPHERGAVVNVRIVRFDDKKVVTAAQGFVPKNVFWSDEKVTLRDGFITHKGEGRRVY